jgi:hypothetical protein
MADSGEIFDFTLKLGRSVAAIESGDAEVIQLQCEIDQVLKIGRGGKNDVSINCAGISWVHTEMRLLPSDGETKSQLVVRDASSNGTGLQLPGKSLVRLPKGEDTPVPDGAIIALPMRLKNAEDQRFCTVHFGTGVGHEAVQLEEAKATNSTEKPLIDDPGARESPETAKAVTNGASDGHGQESQGAKGPSEDAFDSSDDEQPLKRARKTLPKSLPKPQGEGGPTSLPSVSSESREVGPSGDSFGAQLYKPPSGPPGVRPPPRGARPKAAAARASVCSDVPADLRDKILEGETIIRKAREIEDQCQWAQAFDCYQKGLAHFMEVLPKLAKDSAGGGVLRKQINGYLTKAAELKEKLERSKGARKVPRPRSSGVSLPTDS